MLNRQAAISTRPRARISQTLMMAASVLLNAELVFSLVVFALVFAGSSVPALLGNKTMMVTSGSMEPTFRVRDALIIKPIEPSFVRVGDLVTFRNAGDSGMTTHRVVAIKDAQELIRTTIAVAIHL